MIVEIFIAQGDPINSLPKKLDLRMLNEFGISVIRECLAESLDMAQLPVHSTQQ